MEFTLSKELDLSGLKKLEKSVKELNRRHIKFGWIDGKKYPASHSNKGKYIAHIASIQEYGYAGIPSRPYFRQTINMVRYRYRDNLKRVFQNALYSYSPQKNLEILSGEFVKDYSESVLRQNYKALSKVTVKLKGHSYQMDDSGYMIANFKSKVYKTSLDSVKD